MMSLYKQTKPKIELLTAYTYFLHLLTRVYLSALCKAMNFTFRLPTNI